MLAELLLGGSIEGGSRVIDEARRRDRQMWQEKGIDEELGRLETVFHRKFADALRDLADESDNPDELRSLAHRWEVNSDEDALAKEFDDIEFTFESETVVVNRILAVIQDRVGIETESREDVREAIITAYRAALDAFLDEINRKDSDLARLFQDRLQMDIRLHLTEALERLDRLASGPPWRFHRYDPAVPSEIDELVESLWVTDPEETAEFVDRSEVHDLPETNRLLVVGPAGSGKTRVLGELVRDWAEDVSLLLSPKESLQIQGQSEWAFERVEYDGDVFLVWDDIHRVDEQQENRILEDVIPAMSEAVEAYGHDLYVLATARSGDLGDLPGLEIQTPQDIAERDYGLWGSFQPLELGTMDEGSLRTLAERTAKRLNVDFGGSGEDGGAVLDALIARATDRSAPNYIHTVCQSVDGTLTMADVRELPETAAGIWRKQYKKLRNSDSKSDGDQLALLRACKLLYDLGLRRYPSGLTWGVYQHVIRRGESRDDFQDAAKGLADRQWMRIEGGGEDETTYGRGVAYRLHDTQLEAVDRRLDNRVKKFSEFLNDDELTEYTRDDAIPEEFEFHGQFATILHRTGGYAKEAKAHYERALELTGGTERLLDSTSSEVHYNYANLLSEEEAVRDVAAAKQHYEAALRLTSDSGELLDSTDAKAHYNYATLLLILESPDLRRAREHLECSTAHWIDRGIYANALNDVQTLIRVCEAMDDPERALAYSRWALDTVEELDLPDGDTTGRDLRALHAALSARDPTEAVPEAYYHGLGHVVVSQASTAVNLFRSAWERREDLPDDSDVRWMALASGVWLAVHDVISEGFDASEARETVVEMDEPELDSISPTSRALFDRVFTDDEAPDPSDLRERLDTEGDLIRLEIEAYEMILTAL